MAEGRWLMAEGRYGPTGNCFTTASAGGWLRRRLANQFGSGSIVRGDFSRDSCCSMSVYFLMITGHE